MEVLVVLKCTDVVRFVFRSCIPALFNIIFPLPCPWHTTLD